MPSAVPSSVHLAAILVTLAIGINGYKGKSYDFLVKKTSKNISCFDCNNYSLNVTGDRDKYAVLNRYCEMEPQKVKHFKVLCPSENAVGCGVVKTRYQQYSRNPAKRVVYQVKRFCVDQLLPKCEVSEGSRGYITLCTCDKDYCNSAEGMRVTVAGVILSSLLTLAQLRS